jgi:hypothetical protein
MAKRFVTCPCCGRGLPLESQKGRFGVLRGLDDEKLAELAATQGGATWTKTITSRGRGALTNVVTVDDKPEPKARRELVKRCKAFLEAMGE